MGRRKDGIEAIFVLHRVVSISLLWSHGDKCVNARPDVRVSSPGDVLALDGANGAVSKPTN